MRTQDPETFREDPGPYRGARPYERQGPGPIERTEEPGTCNNPESRTL